MEFREISRRKLDLTDRCGEAILVAFVLILVVVTIWLTY